MSMRSLTITGFGIKEESFGMTSVGDKIRFIKTYLPKVYEEMQTDFDMSNKSHYLNFCEEWIDCYEDENYNKGFAVMFANAINENEEGFDVVYANGEYSDEASVLYKDRMPLDMSDRVKSMKADDMREVFRKYLDVLGITADIISRQSVEYYC